jgi:V8-like Glu-specific endopeptidase
MRTGPHSTRRRLTGSLATLACATTAALAATPSAGAASARLHPAPAPRGEAARTAGYWTEARMRRTPPLDAALGGEPLASASFAQVPDPTVPPHTVNGRLFVRQGGRDGFCSATAINTPSRRLVLTAGHCVNSGPFQRPGDGVWSTLLEFVPAYSGEAAPFGAFVAHRRDVFAPRQWIQFGNPNFDVGAVLTAPNASGVNVADAVGGGAALALDRPRAEVFQTFGYPGTIRWMQDCESPYVGDDALTYRIPGPPTIAIGCHWAPGASGGGWLIENGTAIDGLTSYGKRGDPLHTFGPYFSAVNVGRLVAGM